MKRFLHLVMLIMLVLSFSAMSLAQNVDQKPAPQPLAAAAGAETAPCQVCPVYGSSTEYTVGVDDILDINVLKPEELTQEVTVAPDGAISFPYIGSVLVKGHTIEQIQDEIQSRLADGYMKYPVVSVPLKQSLSRNFFVYGEVLKPGSYPMVENMTVLRAISMAGGFTRFGSSSHVKVLRAKKSGVGYETLSVNIKGIMDGDSAEDVSLQQGDIVTVSEGVF